MPSQESEQFLEWTAHLHFSGVHIIHFLGSMLLTVILTPFFDLIPPPRGEGLSPTNLIIFIILFGALLIILPLAVIAWDRMPKPTLRVDQHTITLTDTTTIRTKERRMDATGAKVRAVYIDFLDRLCTCDHRTGTAYHIEITRNGETFLFPCCDEEEQSRIIKQIKALIPSN
jgi:hypothetical protein